MGLKRYKKNPILFPDKRVWWRAEAVFNCAAELYKNKIILLTRCTGEFKDYISRIGFAESRDGIHFKQKSSPVIKPDKKFEKWGCEDPRIARIGDTYYITYVAISKPTHQGGGPPKIALASTKNFKRYKKYGIITPKGADVRDSVIFPGKINGEYVMLHRPFNWTKKDITKLKGKVYVQVKEKKVQWPKNVKLPDYFPKKPSIWICFSKNLKEWYGHKVLMESKYFWEGKKIGAGAQPIKTKEGWLLIYHGVGKKRGKEKYFIGAALLDLNTLRIISRTKNPILAPEKDYEKRGYKSNVIFPTGAIVIRDRIYVYYGAADIFCCLATAKLKDLLKELKK